MQTTVQTFGVVARPKAPEGYEGLWINIYKYKGRWHSGGSYKTKYKADEVAKPWRHDCVFALVRKKNR